MNCTHIDYREQDRRVWEEDLADFIPHRIIDAHAHLLWKDLLGPEVRDTLDLPDTDFCRLEAWSQKLYPGREVHYLVVGTPVPGTDVSAFNNRMYMQVGVDPLSRVNRLTTPACTVKEIEHDIKKMGCFGLKPYQTYTVTGDPETSRIKDFLTEEQMEIADDLGLWVTMHLARQDGYADKQNLDDLEEYTTKRYPRIKWILSHCAMGFTHWSIRDSVDRLKQMPNIWYDLCAVNEARSFITLFMKENTDRLFFGTDGEASAFFHGKWLTLGHSWQKFEADKLPKLQSYPHDGLPILSVYEQLVSIKDACDIAGLSRKQVEDIFWRNAVREFGIHWP